MNEVAAMFTDISKERYEQLSWLWGEETSDPDTQEWRDELTAEEAELVASWDKSFNLGVKSLCQQILRHEPCVATKWHEPELHV